MKDRTDIEKLLEKYWKGETSLEEDKALKSYFNDSEVPLHLRKEKALFQYFQVSKEVEIPKDEFEEKLTKQLKPEEKSKFSWLKIAASVLLLAVATFFIFKTNRQDSTEIIVEKEILTENERIAYEQTKIALLLISSKMNTPNKYTDELARINDAASLFKE